MPLFPQKKRAQQPDKAQPQHPAQPPQKRHATGLFSILRQPAPRTQQPTQRAGLGDVAQTPLPAAGTAASTLLKRYRPLQTRATGGFGSVEICLDSRLQRRVAIKRMPLASPYNRTSLETIDSALKEARTASMLQHPNIVQVIDFSYDSAYAYLVMEYVDGMSLEEFLAQVDGHSLTYDETACIADALVQALALAHENGVLHLDIKPANVLIDRSGHVKLADFGMATLASAAGFGGARGGTIGYMSPEQLNGAEVDSRSDIFSLAAVLYESLCATAPFRAGTPADSLANIERGVIYPSDLLPNIPEATEEALLGALSPLADDRMDDVTEFGDWFCAYLGNPREGRKSLARIINRLTSDEEDEGTEAPNGASTRGTREVDPAEGYLGTRSSHARWAVRGAISGVSVGAISYALLGAMHVNGIITQIATALGIGLAAAVAPQIGSALAVAGWLMLIVSHTPILSVLPVAILGFALTAGWWLVWGRIHPAASVVVAVAAAMGIACGNATIGAPVAVAVAAYFLPSSASAISTAFGLVFAQVLVAALGNTGALASGDALLGLLEPSFLIPAIAFSACAAAASWALDRAWDSYQNNGRTGSATAVYVTLPILSIALRYLAHPMEIASVPTLEVAIATGLGALSSIIVWICVYLLGYKRDYVEGGRS